MKIIFDGKEEEEVFKFYIGKQMNFTMLCKMTGYGQADYTKDFLRMILKAMEGNSRPVGTGNSPGK